MEEFGTRLRYYRRRRRLTQSQLALHVGVAAAYVSQIESALRVPSLKVARKFAAALGLDLTTLLGAEAAAVSTDELTDAQKLEVLQRLTRAVEFDQEYRPHRLDLEVYSGSPGIILLQDENHSVRLYRFRESLPGERAETFHFHPGEEVIYCASGRIHLLVNGTKRSLASGEVHAFSSSEPHLAWGDRGSVAVSTVNPPLTRESYELGAAEWKNGHAALSALGVRNLGNGAA